MHGSTGAPLGGGRTPGKRSRTKVYNVITKPSSSEIQNVFLSSPYDPITKGPQWIAIQGGEPELDHNAPPRTASQCGEISVSAQNQCRIRVFGLLKTSQW